jgi:YD repeat-containing protein
MVFSGDTNAYLVDENGNDAHQLDTIVARATEYATPETMPAELPPNSAFTYCTELTVDGAERVRFDKPVVTWVENFLGIDVGVPVPAGYYDRDKSVWVPAQNGVVVQLLDTDSDGVVDAVDSDGDGQPNDFDEDGLFDDEAQGLDDNATYLPGATYWRIPITHFSPWDFNYSFRPPSDAIAPNSGMAASVNFKNGRHDCNSRKISSYVKDRSCIYHEDIPIPGTDMTLHYASNRTNGYKVTSIVVPVSGDELPDSLKRIDAKVQVGGQTLTQSFSPIPNQFATFHWNGDDVFGNAADRIKTIKVSVGYVYDGQYGMPASGLISFGRSGVDVMMVPTRAEVILWQHEFVSLHLTNGVVADGWTLSDHHHLNPENPTILHKGDGTTIEPVTPIIKTYAGSRANSDNGYGDDGPAYDSFLNYPRGMVVDAEGNTYILTEARIRKVDKNGIITTIAGGGSSSADGIPAIDYDMDYPQCITLDREGNIYFFDAGRVRKIDRNGILTTVAGNGQNGFAGDGGPALDATLNGISSLACDSDGNLYMADQGNYRIRKVDPSGTITTYAGNGIDSYSGRNVPATQASISEPFRIAVGPNGDVYISQQGFLYGGGGHVIRRIDSAGTITTIAGRQRAYSGDGGPAVQAQLWGPQGIAVDALGNIYIADYMNRVVRKIDTRGIINTVAGDTSNSYDDSGLAAVKTGLPSLPTYVAAGMNGDIFIGFYSNRRVLKVGWPSAFKAFTDQNDIPFAEDNGLLHTVSHNGLHRATYDQNTGVVLKSFEYDTNNRLTGIVDQFGNRITIEVDAFGNTTAIVSPDGIRTELTIDSNNHLTQVTFPDTTAYSFEYTSDGLMTLEIEPNGNRYEHIFDDGGLITDVLDEESGHWQYTREVFPEGYIETTVTTAEGNVTSYKDSVLATESYAYTVTLPTGDEASISRSSDSLTLKKNKPCGMTL